jgi:UDPglucose--hexose-1-phosphate uridylyltransferase
MADSLTQHPHRRRNLLSNRWVLVSPHRSKRPWLGQVDEADTSVRAAHDPECFLCAGNVRVTGERNPDYKSVHVFRNDFAALQSESVEQEPGGDPLFEHAAASGECRVICFSPDHARTLPELSHAEVRAIVDCWATQSADLGKSYSWVQVFENKGAMMGCSNPHPHGQIWATNYLPDEASTEEATQRAYLAAHGTAMLLDLAAREAALGARVVEATDHWLAIVPYWASWPFETLLLPRFAVQRLPELNPDQRDDLARIVRLLTARYDNLFKCSFPYSMGWHGAPYGATDVAHWQLHAHFYPPLLRSAKVRKFMVGYEMMAEAQRDLTPETAADMLREAGALHYRAGQN